MYDIISIGKGPAAISAALYTARSGYKTLLIGKDSDLIKTEKIDNYYGFEETISGKDLLTAGENQAKRFGTEIIQDEVIEINYAEDGFEISTTSNTYKAKSILLASGQAKSKVNVSNIDKFEGSGVSYCVVCDGFFFKGKKVGLIGYSDYMANEAEHLKNYTDNVTVYTNGNKIQDENKAKVEGLGYKIEQRKIKSLEGEFKIEKIVFEDGTIEEIEGIFVAYGTASSVDFARKLGINIKNNAIAVDNNQFTGIKGIYAAGDCTGGIKQISVAVGQGAIAGMNIINYLRNE